MTRTHIMIAPLNDKINLTATSRLANYIGANRLIVVT